MESRRQSVAATRADIKHRIERRRGELESDVAVRVATVFDQTEEHFPALTAKLRSAVGRGVDFAIETIDVKDSSRVSSPPVLLMHARIAAQTGIRLETELRAYVAASALISDYLVDSAEESDNLGGVALQAIMRTHAILRDRLLADVSDEHVRARNESRHTGTTHLARQVDSLLAGELVEPAGLPYNFSGAHQAVVVDGLCDVQLLQNLGNHANCRFLGVRRTTRRLWGWFGGAGVRNVETHLREASPPPHSTPIVAIGELAEGLAGWRLSHQQALACLPIGMARRERLVRYADVRVLAAAAQDGLLRTSLDERYMTPLSGNGGALLRRTLDAYFSANRNVSSTAARLGVTRRAVDYRLKKVEAILRQPLHRISNELELALQLCELDSLSRPAVED
jgi:hypothetical protein